ncbi:hypothetical protein CTAYLR_003777 [Chrysophaeum taylorii]|uniref:Cyclic nucleotide-binding domain-containing protein n=1 Tax=Chrysophaeum taylorii TaxID=2483200 RepID=A0AAD7UD55_9STRA|nr:hypothetical protein CTAYLR_003777 [Chrysophaeum taylorii]
MYLDECFDDDDGTTMSSFDISQYSLKEKNKIAGYARYRSAFSTEAAERSDAQCESLRPLLESVRAFQGFLLEEDKHEAFKLCRVMQLVRLPLGGTELMIEGDEGDCCYLVLAGRFEIRTGGTVVGVAKAGDVVGEVALRENSRRSATVTSLEASEVARVNFEDYEPLVKRSDARDYQRKLELLRQAPALRSIRDADVADMGRRLFFQAYSARDVLWREHDELDSLRFLPIVLRGELAVFKSSLGICSVGPGGCVLEHNMFLAALDGTSSDTVRETSLEARTRVEVGWISRYFFHVLVTTNATLRDDVKHWTIHVDADDVDRVIATHSLWSSFKKILLEDIDSPRFRDDAPAHNKIETIINRDEAERAMLHRSQIARRRSAARPDDLPRSRRARGSLVQIAPRRTPCRPPSPRRPPNILMLPFRHPADQNRQFRLADATSPPVIVDHFPSKAVYDAFPDARLHPLARPANKLRPTKPSPRADPHRRRKNCG